MDRGRLCRQIALRHLSCSRFWSLHRFLHQRLNKIHQIKMNASSSEIISQKNCTSSRTHLALLSVASGVSFPFPHTLSQSATRFGNLRGREGTCSYHRSRRNRSPCNLCIYLAGSQSDRSPAPRFGPGWGLACCGKTMERQSKLLIESEACTMTNPVYLFMPIWDSFLVM